MAWMLSSDSHVIEPPDVWMERTSKKYADVMPRVEREDDGDWWVVGGERTFSYSGPSSAGWRFEGGDIDSLKRELKFEDARLGGYIPEMHLKENETDGIWGSVLYPGIAMMVYPFIPDSTAATEAFRAYNDWILDFAGAFPDRLKAVALLNVDDVESAVAEMQRCGERGAVGAAIPQSPLEGHRYDEMEYEALWATAAELGLPLSLHTATYRSPDELGSIVTRAGVSSIARFIQDCIARMIFGGVFERHPTLKVVSVENELGWAPHFIDRMDYAYLERRHYDEEQLRFKDGAVPSDFFRRNISMSFQEDAVGIQLREHIGVDNLLWGSDYPHMESTFPRSRAILDDIFAGVPEEDRTKITCSNTAEYYGFDVPTVEQSS
jgi:predicted TIM-barrel fold metal-dependent hydrolase